MTLFFVNILLTSKARLPIFQPYISKTLSRAKGVSTIKGSKMKVSSKAALLSAFAFPGVGQLYLKVYWRGLVIMLISFVGLGYLIWSATVSALQPLDEVIIKMQSGTMNVQEISGIVGSKTLITAPYHDAVLYFIACLWIFAIIDAYIIGKQIETKKKRDFPLVIT